MRFSITVGFASLAIGLAMSQSSENNLVTRQAKPAPPNGPLKDQLPNKMDPNMCAAIMKRLESGSGGSGGQDGGTAGRSGRRGISEPDNDALTRRAPAASGDQKEGTAQAPADSCDKLSAMVKARQGGAAGAPPKAKPTRRAAMEVPYTIARHQSASNASSTVPPSGTPPNPGGMSTIPPNNATGNGSAIAPPKASSTGKPSKPSRRDVHENEHHLNSRQTSSNGTMARLAGLGQKAKAAMST